MKVFTAAPEIAADIEKRISELHDLCETNDIPFIAAFFLSFDGEQGQKAISANLNGEKGIAPVQLIAACEILRAQSVGAGLVSAVTTLQRLADEEGCQCPSCTAASEAAACDCPDCVAERAEEAAEPTPPAPSIH